jgi:hypothetical protein
MNNQFITKYKYVKYIYIYILLFKLIYGVIIYDIPN